MVAVFFYICIIIHICYFLQPNIVLIFRKEETMYPYTICIDASVDIPSEVITDNGIIILPMEYMLDNRQCLMRERLTEEELKDFYDAMRAGSLTSTSQITPYYYKETFEAEASKGNSILYISLSGGLSNTYLSAQTAAADVMEAHPEIRIEVVDSLSATGGMGLLLLAAIGARKDGLSLEDNAAWLRENTSRICHWFLVDDLVYLRRGGRISAAAAVTASVLNIKPILKIADDGKLVTIAKKRGLAKASAFLVECCEHAINLSLPKEIIVAHADAPEQARLAAGKLTSMYPDCRVQICGLGPVIGAHTGPGMLAVIHWGNRNYA